MSFGVILMAFAIVLLVLAAFGIGAPRFQLGWGGLALWCVAAAMRAILIAALVFAPSLSLPAYAGPMGCTGFAELQGFAHETITVAGTSIGFTSATYAPPGTRSADMAVVSVESFAIRTLDDGVAPTASVGQPVAAGAGVLVCGAQVVQSFRMIRQTSSATVQVSYYRVSQ